MEISPLPGAVKKFKSGTHLDKQEQIRQRLKEMASEVGPDFTLLAKVKSVDEVNNLCDLTDDESGLDFFDVRLRPVLDDKNSITLVPKVGTWALAVRLEDSDDWMIIAVGEIDKFKLSATQVVFNGGANGGIVKWPNAKEQHDLVKQFINAIKNVIDGAPINEPGSGSPSALQAALASAIGGIDVPDFDNLEDTTITH